MASFELSAIDLLGEPLSANVLELALGILINFCSTTPQALKVALERQINSAEFKNRDDIL